MSFYWIIYREIDILWKASHTPTRLGIINGYRPPRFLLLALEVDFALQFFAAGQITWFSEHRATMKYEYTLHKKFATGKITPTSCLPLGLHRDTIHMSAVNITGWKHHKSESYKSVYPNQTSDAFGMYFYDMRLFHNDKGTHFGLPFWEFILWNMPF